MVFSPRHLLVIVLATFFFWGKTLAQTPQPAALPWVQVKGPHFVTERGDTLVFKGLSISDPDKIRDAGHWSKTHFQNIRNWGTQLVRIPVHPRAWRKRGETEYLKMLDEAVKT